VSYFSRGLCGRISPKTEIALPRKPHIPTNFFHVSEFIDHAITAKVNALYSRDLYKLLYENNIMKEKCLRVTHGGNCFVSYNKEKIQNSYNTNIRCNQKCMFCSIDFSTWLDDTRDMCAHYF